MSPVRRGEARAIHNRVAVLRAERGLSRAALADRVAINPQTVGALERGDHYPSLDLAFRICEVLCEGRALMTSPVLHRWVA